MRVSLSSLSGSFWWCDVGWCASGTPISGYVRPLYSRLIMKLMTRVRSVWYASTCRSNISLACSSNEVGTPSGAAMSGNGWSTWASAFWMRRSMSRTASRYSPSLWRSRGPRSRRRCATLSVTASSRLRFCSMRASRAAGSVPPVSPSSRSKTVRGLVSMGSGVVALRQQMVLV